MHLRDIQRCINQNRCADPAFVLLDCVSDMARSFDAVACDINRICDQIAENNDCMVEFIDQAIDILMVAGLAVARLIHPSFVGCWSGNRYKYMLDPSKVHRKGDGLFGKHGMGWSMKEMQSNSFCLELPMDGIFYDENLNGNVSLTQLSEGKLSMPTTHLKYVSLSGSHMTAFVNDAIDGCDTFIPALAGADGKLDKEAFCKRSPSFKVACDAGWRWVVLDFKVAAKFPKLLEYVQESRNAPGHLQGGETELQVLLKIDSFEAEREAAKKGEDDAGLLQCVLRSQAPCVKYADVLIKFYKTWSGGPGSKTMSDLCDYAKTCEYGDRECHASFYKAITDANIGDVCMKNALVRFALLKNQIPSPEQKIANGVCTYIKESDVSKLEKKDMSVNVALCESLHAEIRSISANVSCGKLTNAVRVRLEGLADVRLNDVLLDKKEKDRVKFLSFGHVCHTFRQELSKVVGVEIESRWEVAVRDADVDAKAKAAPDKSARPKVASNFVARNAAGQLVGDAAPLRMRGFTEGATVKCRESTQVGANVGVAGDAVSIDADGVAIAVSVMELLKKWATYNVQVDEEAGLYISVYIYIEREI